MFDEGKFVRYGVNAPTFIAPGGGEIGMTTAEIKKLYSGKVEQWRVGVPPQVGYVEGCA